MRDNDEFALKYHTRRMRNKLVYTDDVQCAAASVSVSVCVRVRMRMGVARVKRFLNMTIKQVQELRAFQMRADGK